MFKAGAQRICMTLTFLAFLGVAAPASFDAAYARSAREVVDVENERLPPGATASQVEQAVLSVLTTRGLQIMARAPGSVDAQYARRGFTATLRVSYTAEAFSITYLDSTGLEYDPQRRTIHPNYNRWVANIKMDIPRVVQNSVMGAPSPAS